MLLPALVVLSLLSLMLLPSSSTLAQGPPTPTNVVSVTPGPAGEEADENGAPPPPPGALVSGYVYDYSRAARQPGIPVVIDGGGWQAETVSDSNGYYRFVDLGAGTAVLNLRLPSGAQPVAPNWPVTFGRGAEVRVNLGYYWGDSPPLPVVLSAEVRDSALVARVENHTHETATDGLVDIVLPAGIKALPAVQTSQGTVDYGERRVRVTWSQLPAGASVTAQVPLQKIGAAMAPGRSPGRAAPLNETAANRIRVMFTYNQQITPQLEVVDPGQVTEAGVLKDAEPMAEAAPETFMPITGTGAGGDNLALLVLPILLILGLGVAGWRRSRAKEDRDLLRPFR
jgi:hypothetical protein